MKKKIKLYNKDNIQLASMCLENGELIVVPTDTVYGIIANSRNSKAVNNIFKVKKRPKSMPLIIFIDTLISACKIAYFSKIERDAANYFWPGSLTLIVKKKKNNLFYGDKRSQKIGIRIPNHPVVLNILKKISFPLARTSANIHSENNVNDLKKLNILHEEEITFGIQSKHRLSFEESTIIEISNQSVKVLREGFIKKIEIEKFLKKFNHNRRIL